VDIARFFGSAKVSNEFLILEVLTVNFCGLGSQISRLPTHTLMDDEHTGVGSTFGYHILEKDCAPNSKK